MPWGYQLKAPYFRTYETALRTAFQHEPGWGSSGAANLESNGGDTQSDDHTEDLSVVATPLIEVPWCASNGNYSLVETHIRARETCLNATDPRLLAMTSSIPHGGRGCRWADISFSQRTRPT